MKVSEPHLLIPLCLQLQRKLILLTSVLELPKSHLGWLRGYSADYEVQSLTLGPAFPGKPSSPFSPRSPCKEHKRSMHKLLWYLCSTFAGNGEEYFNSVSQNHLEGVNGAIWEYLLEMFFYSSAICNHICSTILENFRENTITVALKMSIVN